MSRRLRLGIRQLRRRQPARSTIYSPRRLAPRSRTFSDAEPELISAACCRLANNAWRRIKKGGTPMDLSPRREDLVEKDRANERPDHPGCQKAGSDPYTHPEDQVWPIVIDCGAAETFVDGAGI
jgi:hypothetical protein